MKSLSLFVLMASVVLSASFARAEFAPTPTTCMEAVSQSLSAARNLGSAESDLSWSRSQQDTETFKSNLEFAKNRLQRANVLTQQFCK